MGSATFQKSQDPRTQHLHGQLIVSSAAMQTPSPPGSPITPRYLADLAKLTVILETLFPVFPRQSPGPVGSSSPPPLSNHPEPG